MTSPAINTAPPMARPMVKIIKLTKQKREQPANSTNKQAEKNWASFAFYYVFEQIWHLTSLAALHITARDCI